MTTQLNNYYEICPTYWLKLVNTNSKPHLSYTEGKEYTPWFSGETKPSKIGWYDRMFTDGLFRHFWDGSNWLSTISGCPHWRQVGDYPAWRGLRDQYNLTKLQSLMVLVDDYKDSSPAKQKETRANLERHLKKLLVSN